MREGGRERRGGEGREGGRRGEGMGGEDTHERIYVSNTSRIT